MDISVTPHGPYVVGGRTPLHRARPVRTAEGEPVAWEHDPPLRTEENYALCRCGGSRHKPFCDGSHATRDWDDTETAPTTTYDERARTLAGDGLTVRDDRGTCQHAGFCTNRTSNVWKLVRATEATPVTTQVVGMVEHCPSGALTYRLPGADHDLEPDLAPAITVTDDGPLWVTGGIPVTRADGQPMQTRIRVTLCRCGASRNKPLCDGSHAEAGFSDAG